jgi:uncharacterized membrane protein
MNVWKQVRAVLLLPGIIAVIIPATILYFTGLVWPPSPWNVVIGSVFMILGLALMVSTNRLFATVGNGPWLHGTRPRGSW